MPYTMEVKERAREIDPECWISYSGRERRFKQRMDERRSSALEQAAREARMSDHPVFEEEYRCARCGQSLTAEHELEQLRSNAGIGE